MIPIPPELESHLQGEVTTHCFAWIIRRSDQIVLGFTDHDRTLIIDGVSCEPLSGLNSSEASTQLGLSVAGGEVEGILSSSKISDADIELGRFDDAVIEAYLANWQKPEQHVVLRRWTAGKITRAGNRFVMELKGVAAAFDAVKGRRIQRNCSAALGDGRCGINLSDPRYFANGTVSRFEGTTLEVVGLSQFADGWFSNGTLTWQSGANAGRTIHCVSHSGATLQLIDPPILPLSGGERFHITAGCDKSFTTCKAKFSNGINFRGFPHLPGNDAAFAYVTSANEYDGGALVL